MMMMMMMVMKMKMIDNDDNDDDDDGGGGGGDDNDDDDDECEAHFLIRCTATTVCVEIYFITEIILRIIFSYVCSNHCSFFLGRNRSGV